MKVVPGSPTASPSRFMLLTNPGLARLLDETVGEGWVTDLAQLRKLDRYADDAAFQDKWREVKRSNRNILAERIRAVTDIVVNPEALFDIQVKQIHEYKRQHLTALYIITLYQRLRRNVEQGVAPRCFVFGGKAAPGYAMAKLMIRVITGIPEVVNNDGEHACRGLFPSGFA